IADPDHEPLSKQELEQLNNEEGYVSGEAYYDQTISTIDLYNHYLRDSNCNRPKLHSSTCSYTHQRNNCVNHD
ncbi:hypothetical protein ACUOFC_49060, partial [Escherichia sp. TWPC-MK]